MHPNAFLTTLWRPEALDHVFVAMSFEGRFDSRFSDVIRPAVEDQELAGCKLVAKRVDNSKSGDSILTEIVSGIAHAKLVLADVSVIDEGMYTQVPIRNGNVMYEVGIALACRSPSEVILVRDDAKPLLFDLSTIPTVQIDFQEKPSAIATIRSLLNDRLQERKLIHDARVLQAVDHLSPNELMVLQILAKVPEGRAANLEHPEIRQLSIPTANGLSGLLQRGFAKAAGRGAGASTMYYELTPFGRSLAAAAEVRLPRLQNQMQSEGPGGVA